MNQPTPAIVSQHAVWRLPRWALWLFSLAYVLPGFIGRGPWKREDVTAFGYMTELARGQSDWWHPTLLGQPPEFDALLPYWLGAWAIQWAPSWLSPDLAARLPFMALLMLTLIATWYATYNLARSPLAQPVNFAFGGEAQPTDYARAIADAGVLALIACLGLAQIGHETTPALTQLCCTALLFYGVCALPRRVWIPGLAILFGLIGLALSGAPSMAMALGVGFTVLYLLEGATAKPETAPHWGWALGIGLVTLAGAVLASEWQLWHWRIDLPAADLAEWQSLGRLFLWFTWPAWPMVLWTLWRWRFQWVHLQFAGRHIWLPLWLTLVACVATLTTHAADRSLLLALPAMAALAAFALPTWKRSVSALIDWFALIFFSGCALIIWVVWLSMQTGVPAQPAHNVERLAPGFVHQFSILTWLIALVATGAWAWLVSWRAGRHRAALWKSLVLPAGGAALCWLLLMTLWLPLLDYARSDAPLVQRARSLLPEQVQCVTTLGLNRSQIAAFSYFSDLTLSPSSSSLPCPWLIADGENSTVTAGFRPGEPWQLRASFSHPANRKEQFLLFERLEK